MSVRMGDMMNSDRNRASPASTWFGGIDGNARALRVMASTTKILVNDVIISSSAGATDSRVMPIRVTMAEEGAPLGPLISTVGPAPGVATGVGVAGSIGTIGSVGASCAAWPVEATSRISAATMN